MGILDKVTKKKETGDASSKKQAAVAVEKKSAEAPHKPVVRGSSEAYFDVLRRSVLSEKGTMQESYGQYTFIVRGNATKVDVKQAVHSIYGVQPTRVHIINVQGKHKQFGRNAGRRSDIKKAIVTLPKGQKIDIHEGV